MTDTPADSVTPGSSQGIRYTARAQTTSGSAFEEDITSSAAGPQQGTATLTNVVEWYAVCAVFHPYPATPPLPPSTPAGLEATSVASTRVALSWSPSTGSVAGYTVYRNGVAIGMTGPDTTIFLDWDLTPGTTHTYAVDAFDLVNDHSGPSAPLTVTTPAVSPEFVQGVAASPGYRTTSYSLTLTEPVLAGDLLVGWFSQYDVSGQVQVRDNVNGAWTRSVATDVHRDGDAEESRRGHPDGDGDLQGRPEHPRRRHPETARARRRSRPARSRPARTRSPRPTTATRTSREAHRPSSPRR